MLIGFLLYLACGVLFYALALYARWSQRPVSIWANEKARPVVSDTRAYNRAFARLFAVYGSVLALCGVPILLNAHMAVLMVISILGVIFATLAMAAFAIRIDDQYRMKR